MRGALGLWLFVSACGSVATPAEGVCTSELRGVEGEECMGQLTEQTLTAVYGVYDDEALTAYVRAVGERVAGVADRPSVHYRFVVLDTAYPQAWAAPGGRILITRGLITRLGSEAELAGVLAHEIGHHAGGHLDRLIDDLNAPRWDDVIELTHALEHEQDQERQADQLAVIFLRRAGYDVTAAGAMLEAVYRDADEEREAWAHRHPPLPVRLALVARAADGETAGERHADRFHAHLDGVVAGHDPRDGHIEGHRFAHQRAGIRFRVPSDWPVPEMNGSVFGAWDEGHRVAVGFVRLGRAGEGYPERSLRSDLAEHDHGTVQLAGREALSGWLPEGRGTRVNVGADVGLAKVTLFTGRDGGAYALYILGVEAERAPLVALFDRVVASFEPFDGAIEPPRVSTRRLSEPSTLATLRGCAQADDRELLSLINGHEADERLGQGSFVRCIAR